MSLPWFFKITYIDEFERNKEIRVRTAFTWFRTRTAVSTLNQFTVSIQGSEFISPLSDQQPFKKDFALQTMMLAVPNDTHFCLTLSFPRLPRHLLYKESLRAVAEQVYP